jgi:hypothetical protein
MARLGVAPQASARHAEPSSTLTCRRSFAYPRPPAKPRAGLCNKEGGVRAQARSEAPQVPSEARKRRANRRHLQGLPGARRTRMGPPQSASGTRCAHHRDPIPNRRVRLVCILSHAARGAHWSRTAGASVGWRIVDRHGPHLSNGVAHAEARPFTVPRAPELALPDGAAFASAPTRLAPGAALAHVPAMSSAE